MIIFEQIVADPLSGPDLQPLNPSIWSVDMADGLSCQIANNCCEGDTAGLEGVNYITQPLSPNQWASVALKNILQGNPGQNAELDLILCGTVVAGILVEPYYDFALFDSLSGTAYTLVIDAFHDHTITNLLSVDIPYASLPPGTELKVAAYSNPGGSKTLAIYLNDAEFHSVIDIVFQYSGGIVELFIVDLSSPTDIQVTDFKAGNIVQVPDSSSTKSFGSAPIVTSGRFPWWWKKKKWA